MTDVIAAVCMAAYLHNLDVIDDTFMHGFQLAHRFVRSHPADLRLLQILKLSLQLLHSDMTDTYACQSPCLNQHGSHQ
jgi:hypothetical protein